MAIILMLALIILLVILKVTNYNFGNKVLSDATTIGLSIGVSFLFLIITYFLIAELIIEKEYLVELLVNHDRRRKNSSRIQIENLD